MSLSAAPLPTQSDTPWPVRRAMVVWLAASAAFWIPVLIGAYWLLDGS